MTTKLQDVTYMVLLLDDRSKYDAHAWSLLGIFICIDSSAQIYLHKWSVFPSHVRNMFWTTI